MEITPTDDRALPGDVRERLEALPPISIYRMLAIVPGALIPWTDLVGALYECELEPRFREIAICRQARTARAPYELHQHRVIARNNGVSVSELDAVLSEPVVTSLDDNANLVCRAADELETSATLSNETQERLYSVLGHRQATELVLIISFYCAVARFTNATRAQIEPDNPLAHTSNPNIR
jgi:alkylhydroperoxidase family enzyme